MWREAIERRGREDEVRRTRWRRWDRLEREPRSELSVRLERARGASGGRLEQRKR
jgi:hypothetical protein